ncbi:hypothetical protein KKH3_00130 [Pectobacterium actinidiae]|nr:hypothetical protein KKH3_00130 [Pectobacterium actinidiae]
MAESSSIKPLREAGKAIRRPASDKSTFFLAAQTNAFH